MNQCWSQREFQKLLLSEWRRLKKFDEVKKDSVFYVVRKDAMKGHCESSFQLGRQESGFLRRILMWPPSDRQPNFSILKNLKLTLVFRIVDAVRMKLPNSTRHLRPKESSSMCVSHWRRASVRRLASLCWPDRLNLKAELVAADPHAFLAKLRGEPEEDARSSGKFGRLAAWRICNDCLFLRKILEIMLIFWIFPFLHQLSRYPLLWKLRSNRMPWVSMNSAPCWQLSARSLWRIHVT